MEKIMSLRESINKRINTLKATTVKVYSNSGEIYEECRDKNGELCKTKLNDYSCGYVIDHTPDLQIGKILPWMYLGSQDVVHDSNLLKENNITHILSIGVPCPAYNGIFITFVEAYDTDEFNIESLFDKCFRVIDDAKESFGIVFVHCNAGISRSATIAAAYLIRYYAINREEALKLLQKERPRINPNSGFRKALEKYANYIAQQKNT